MGLINSLLEINDIYKPLIPFGLILIFVNLNGSVLIYILAVAAILVGFIGLFIKNIWTQFIAGFLFASTGSYMVLSLFEFYSSHFGIFVGIIIILVALLIIIGGLFAMYRAIIGEEKSSDQENHNTNYSKEYAKNDYEDYEEEFLEDN